MDPFSLPPGPKLPPGLQGAWLAYRPFEFLKRCRARHGETFTLRVPSLGPVPIFTRPADIARIFNLDGTLLAGGSAQSPLVDFAGDRSLMKLDGAAHREHREILRKAFRPAGLPDGGEHALEQIRQAVGNWPLGKRFNLGMAVDQLALGLVSDLALGRAPHELLVAAAARARGPAPSSAARGLAPPRAGAAGSFAISCAAVRCRALPRVTA